MTTLTQDQAAALDAIEAFISDTEPQEGTGKQPTAFLLEGGAGVGKTFLLGQVLARQEHGIRCVATPTHKATNVIRKKLDGFGVDWVRGYDPFGFDEEQVITGTTAALLGIGPVISDDQSATEVKFGTVSQGILGKVTPRLLIIDEVSMLGYRDFLGLVKRGQRAGMKILAIGDAGQLPPVKEQAIPFDKFRFKATLRQIVRQAEGSAIVGVAWAIRDGKPWESVRGDGLRRVGDGSRMADAFLEVVAKPGERAEEDREVFIAYRNAVVDRALEAACQKVYGHPARAFAPGELVLSETNFYGGPSGKSLLCANQDELIVERFHEDEADPALGIPVTLRHRGRPGAFRAHYLSPEQLADREHPYAKELARLREQAVRLQARFKETPYNAAGRGELDRARKQAWREFFTWERQTIISFRHPFAITSHKSQGSTYKQVFADTADLARFSRHALYVAVTRPREELVVAG